MAQRPGQFGRQDIEIPEINKNVVFFILLFFVGSWLAYTSFYSVDADEVGVVQRFGKYVSTNGPGLHFKIPFGVETVRKVKVQRVLKDEFGFRTALPGVRTTFNRGDYSTESLMLTGDLNVAIVDWIVQYRVKDPVQFLFNVRNVRETLRDVTEAAMREVVGDHSVDEVIIASRQEISQNVSDMIQNTLDEYETGIDIVTVNLQDVNPPKPVQPAFNAVNEAKQEKERIINQALEEYNKVIPQAQGRAEQTIRQAEGYAINRTNRAEGEAEKFMSVYNEYVKAKDVTRRRLYLEMMMEIMPQLDQVFIVDEGQDGLVPLLQLQNQKKGGGQ